MNPTIVYTKTDEAPMLATYSLLPVIQTFLGKAGINVETADISLSARILAVFHNSLAPEQQVPDALAYLGELVKKPGANVIKLPNISASLPQLKMAVAELQAKGFALPDYPEEPADRDQKAVKAMYDCIKGSAVNPVIREGNSDRRCAASVKAYAKKHPHSMGAWEHSSLSHVASMNRGDFYGSEKSVVVAKDCNASIVCIGESGDEHVLVHDLVLEKDEILDAAVMSHKELAAFYRREIEDAKAKDVLFSLHLKATMMKVSDPVMFGCCVREFFRDVFDRFGRELESAGVDADNGLGDLYAKIEVLPEETRRKIHTAIEGCYAQRPDLAMVDSDRGITNLHVPSDVIIDASMPAAIRASGRMWGPDGIQKDTKYVIPDRCYAGVYAATVNYCREHGAFDPATMGSVANVGLMARKAEEYGSHDKTFRMTVSGVVRIIDADGTILLEQHVEEGDVFRACQTKDEPVRDWIRLAVRRARATGAPAVFWLDSNRAHDRELIRKIEQYLPEHDTQGLDICILSPDKATVHALERSGRGLDTISVTGNVLRDYLTDLFPILELGTSAKMLSIVPLLAGGGLFETGAGGSAPKHVQQFLQEGHLRWDSLGEFLALAVSLEHLSETTGNNRARVFASALDRATGVFLEENRSPSRKAGEIDNRGSHFYLALYWAEELAGQNDDADVAQMFVLLAHELRSNEDTIIGQLNAAQGKPVDLGGYYFPDEDRLFSAMRPSTLFNDILSRL